jgi:hypothetical protein
MHSSTSEPQLSPAIRVTVTKDAVAVDLADGRTVIAPLVWYPRLLHGSTEERKRWRLIGRGEGIHWPDLDEDISVDGLLAGRPSGESQRSFKRWLADRAPSAANKRMQPTRKRARG